jgi:aminoglycoside phosphotransferase (APT) family kinase protein
MTMLRRSSSILRILHSISRPMKSPMSPGRRMSTWRGGQEDRHADVDEQAALDLAHDLALDDVAFLVGV